MHESYIESSDAIASRDCVNYGLYYSVYESSTLSDESSLFLAINAQLAKMKKNREVLSQFAVLNNISTGEIT